MLTMAMTAIIDRNPSAFGIQPILIFDLPGGFPISVELLQDEV